MTPYTHRPLETPTTIRLALLLPNVRKSESDIIKVGLEHHEISAVSKLYGALSYVWGDPSKIHAIEIDGQEFGITKSPMYFLQRPREEQCYFWIDAICINQDEDAVEEKAVQILLMEQIYESAKFVHIDLGPAATKAEEYAMNEMEHMYNTIFLEFNRMD